MRVEECSCVKQLYILRNHNNSQSKYIKFTTNDCRKRHHSVESACLPLIVLYWGTFRVVLKCYKLRHRFSCFFELGIRSFEEFSKRPRSDVGVYTLKKSTLASFKSFSQSKPFTVNVYSGTYVYGEITYQPANNSLNEYAFNEYTLHIKLLLIPIIPCIL